VIAPASARKVLEIISKHHAISLKNLQEETKLPERTLRFALNLLKQKSLISENFSLGDVRNKIIQLNLKSGGKNGK